VITAVLGHITRGLPPVSLTAKTKTSPDAFGRDSGEGVVEVQHGELVAGVLDKAQFGQYGIVHSMQVRLRLGFRVGYRCWWRGMSGFTLRLISGKVFLV